MTDFIQDLKDSCKEGQILFKKGWIEKHSAFFEQYNEFFERNNPVRQAE